jgi:hypothetical protein
MAVMAVRTLTMSVFLVVMKTDGTSAVRLTTDPTYENWWPRISERSVEVSSSSSVRS